MKLISLIHTGLPPSGKILTCLKVREITGGPKQRRKSQGIQIELTVGNPVHIFGKHSPSCWLAVQPTCSLFTFTRATWSATPTSPYIKQNETMWMVAEEFQLNQLPKINLVVSSGFWKHWLNSLTFRKELHWAWQGDDELFCLYGFQWKHFWK